MKRAFKNFAHMRIIISELQRIPMKVLNYHEIKFTVYAFFTVLFLTTSCQKEEFIYNFPETGKLLVSVSLENRDREYFTEFKYDSLNRIIEILEFHDGEQIRQESFIYNKQGHLIEKNSGTFKYSYKYNVKDQLIEQNTHFTPEKGKWEWDVKTEYKYKSGRITRGIVYPRKYVGIENSGEAEELSYISYRYDLNGNTVEQNSGYGKFEFKYDTKINPLAEHGIQTIYGYSFVHTLQPVARQVNNPVYCYSENQAMSTSPPEYEISYKYDSGGLPLKAEIKNVHYPEQETIFVDYGYQPKN